MKFLLQDFCILYIILSEIVTKDVLEFAANPAYLIRCCDCTSAQPCPQDYFKLCANIQYNTQDEMLQILALLVLI